MISKFVIQNIFRKKFVAIISTTGIGFGLMLMFVLGAFNAGVSAQVAEDFYKVLGVVELTETEQFGSNSQLPVDIPEKLLESTIGDDIIAYNAEVELPTSFTAFYRINNYLPSEQDSLKLIGVDPNLDETWEGPTTKIREGGRSFTPESYEIIIDSRIADEPDRFQFNLGIGDTLPIYVSYPNTSINVIEFEVVGIFEQADNGAPDFVPRDYFFYIDLNTAWELREIAWNEPYSYFDYYTSIDIRFPATSTEETQVYIDEIQSFPDLGVNLEAFSLAEFEESIGESLGVINTFTTVISVITALAGGMAIIVAQLNSVSQRMKEFAILKATGWKNSHIFKNVIMESLFLGVLGAAVGIGLGFGLIQLFSGGNGFFGDINARVTFPLIAQIVIFALGIGVIGGLYPGIKASKVRPVKVLKGG